MISLMNSSFAPQDPRTIGLMLEKSELEKGTMDEHDFADEEPERCYWCGNAIEGEPQLVNTTEDGGNDPVIIRVPVCEDCYAKLEEEK